MAATLVPPRATNRATQATNIAGDGLRSFTADPFCQAARAMPMEPDGTAKAATFGPSTRAVHAGIPGAADGEPFLPPPALASSFHLAGPSDASPYGYTRYANPSWTALEAALGELEGGPALIFGSGMAAVSALVLTAVGDGDVLVV